MERQYVNMLKNMHQVPTEWNFYDEHKYVLKPANDRTATAIAYGLENEQKQLFLPILDLSNLNSSVFLIAFGSESSTCSKQGPDTWSQKGSPTCDHTTT
jgi:hypothetical protein